VPDDLPSRNPDVVFRRLDNDMVLVHMKTNEIYALNPTGARFWELFADGLPRGQIEQRMLAEFAVEPGQLAGEIDRLLADLARHDLVTRA
jgi:Coenzyme PQQ synthesis protein D (PqqD)